MLQAHIWCPFPLVVRVVKLARENGGYELPIYHQPDQTRHLLGFEFPLISDFHELDNKFMDEAIKLVCEWSKQNEPD